MPAALWKLLALRWRAQRRRAVRQMRTVRGALATLFMVGVALWFIASATLPFVLGSHVNPSAGLARDLMPAGMFLLWLLTATTSAGDRAVSFSPAEVDLLFAAPFTRRGLLAYKLWSAAPALLIMPLFLLPAAAPYCKCLPAAVVALWLFLAFMQLSTMALAFVRHSATELAYTRRRRAALAAAAALAIIGFAQALAGVDWSDWHALVQRFHHSWAGACLLAPFDVFSRAALAETLPSAAGWLAAALAIDGLLVAVVMQLDVAFLEIAADASRRHYEQRRRMRQGGMLPAKVNVRRGMPRLPFWRGAGPVAWRQSLHLRRTSKNMLWRLSVLGAALAIGLRSTGRSESQFFAIGFLAALGYLTFIITISMPFGLRLDVDRLDVLKSLPLGPQAVVWGELLPACVCLSCMHYLAVAILLAIAPSQWPFGAAAAAFAPLINLLLVGSDNFLFLLFPYRSAADVAGDFHAVSRQMFLMFLRLPLLLAWFAMAAAAGGIAALWAPGQWAAPLAAAWLTLCLASLAQVCCVNWAFRRFDVSQETPGD